MDVADISDAELRRNYEFVVAFENLRKRHGYREMSDTALSEIANATDIPLATLRVARHLRNAIAHADPVNPKTLADHRERLRAVLDGAPAEVTSVRSEAATPNTLAWRMHAWLDSGLEQQMLANGFVSMGAAEMDDLTGVTDPTVIRDRLVRTMPDRKPAAFPIFVGYWRRFLWEAQIGDLIVLPLRDRTVAIGEFVGPYHFVGAAEVHSRHRRAVSWNSRASRDLFPADLLKTLNSKHTIVQFKAPDAVARLRSLGH